MQQYPIESIHKWIHDDNIVNEKGEEMIFTDHMFLFEPYQDFSPRQVYKKSVQVGVSVMQQFKCFHGMKSEGWNIIYTLPSDNDVEEFVPTKTDKIIFANPELINHLQANNVYRKGLYDRFLYFKGTRSKTAALMTTADLLVHDELDRSDLGVVQDYRGRTQRSKYQGIWELSNPSVKNSGVDVSWKRSDRKEWAVMCPHCQIEQVIEWGKNVDYVNKVYMCRECGGEITDTARRKGRWAAANPDSPISGYHISQVMAPWRSAANLIQEESETNEEYFQNFILGEPIGDGDAEDFRQLVIDAWTPKELKKPPYFMGVDIGSTKHYVIGNRDGIFQIGKVKTRQELELLIEHFNPTTVMDAGPERTWAEEFRMKYPKLYLNFYKRDKDKKQVFRFGDNEKEAGLVYSDRSRVIDAVVTAIAYADIQFDLSPEDLEAYIKHWIVMVKKKEIDSLGLARFVWDKNSESAQDHWVHATVYYYIARSRGGPVSFQPLVTEDKPLVVMTENGAEMQDLKEYMESRNQ